MKTTNILLALILIAIIFVGYYEVTEYRLCETHVSHELSNLTGSTEIYHRYLK